jgi:hypothetical protein
MRFTKLFGTFMIIAYNSLLTNYFSLGLLTKETQLKPDVSNVTGKIRLVLIGNVTRTGRVSVLPRIVT